LYATLADLILLLHLGFVAFVSVGALALLFWPRLALLHVPCLMYGAAIELVGWICPLTPLEQHLRRHAGQEGYAGGFVEHYVGDLLYPGGWDKIRVWLGLGLVAFNLVVYAYLIARIRRTRTGGLTEAD
jgi:hypothetical protein